MSALDIVTVVISGILLCMCVTIIACLGLFGYRRINGAADTISKGTASLQQVAASYSHTSGKAVQQGDGDEEGQQLLHETKDASSLDAILRMALLAERVYQDDMPDALRRQSVGDRLKGRDPGRWQGREMKQTDPNKSHFVVMWRTDPGNRCALRDCLVVVRGTESMADVQRDVAATPIPMKGQSGTKGWCSLWSDETRSEPLAQFLCPRGADKLDIHQGFHDRAWHMWRAYARLVTEQGMVIGPETRFLVTGHSLGGAVAAVFSLVLAHRYSDVQRIHCVTFGQPRFVMHRREMQLPRSGSDAPSCAPEGPVYVHTEQEDMAIFQRNMTSFLAGFGGRVTVQAIRTGTDPVPNVPMRIMGKDMALHVNTYSLMLEDTAAVARVACDQDAPAGIQFVVRRRPSPKDEAVMDSHMSTVDRVMAYLSMMLNAGNHKMATYVERLTDVRYGRQQQVGRTYMSKQIDKAMPVFLRFFGRPRGFPEIGAGFLEPLFHVDSHWWKENGSTQARSSSMAGVSVCGMHEAQLAACAMLGSEFVART